MNEEFLAGTQVPESYTNRLKACHTVAETEPPLEGNKWRPCSMLSDIVKPMTESELSSGYLYYAVCRAQNGRDALASIMKIGVTEFPIQRKGQIQSTYGMEIIDFKYWSTCFARRVEALVHAELRIRNLQRLCQCAGRTCKTKNHKEWFEIDQDGAAAIIQYWISWNHNYKPYTNTGTLSTGCTELLQTEHSGFLLNCLGDPWHRPGHDAPPCEEWASCTCTSRSECVKGLNIREIQDEASTRSTTSEGGQRDPMDSVNSPAAANSDQRHALQTPIRARRSRRSTNQALSSGIVVQSGQQLLSFHARSNSVSGEAIYDAVETPPPLSASNSNDSHPRHIRGSSISSCPPTPTPGPEHPQTLSSQRTWEGFSDVPEVEVTIDPGKDILLELQSQLPLDDVKYIKSSQVDHMPSNMRRTPTDDFSIPEDTIMKSIELPTSTRTLVPLVANNRHNSDEKLEDLPRSPSFAAKLLKRRRKSLTTRTKPSHAVGRDDRPRATHRSTSAGI